MKIDFDKTIRKAFELVWKNSYLAVLGIFAAFGAGGGNFSSIWNSKTSNSPSAESVLYFFSNTGHRISIHVAIVTIIAAVTFIVGLVLIYLSISARAGLIIAVDSLDGGENKFGFWSALFAGGKFFWRMIGFMILLGLAIFVIIAILIGLIVGLILLAVFVTPWLLIVAIPISLAIIFAIIVIAIFFGLLTEFAVRILVLEKKSITGAIKSAINFIKMNLGQIILARLIQVAISIAVGIAFAITAITAGVILFALGFGIYKLGGINAGIIYGFPVALIFLVAIIYVGGGITAYFSSYWTLAYKQLRIQS
ncbi:MAG: hypothetical protein NTW79_02275 [Candidatus Berkelbacteria bacterium]|nr:hypothetical protein [Candidatus Berkelbacteria bacterium]